MLNGHIPLPSNYSTGSTWSSLLSIFLLSSFLRSTLLDRHGLSYNHVKRSGTPMK